MEAREINLADGECAAVHYPPPPGKAPPRLRTPFHSSADTELTSFHIVSRFKSSRAALVLWLALLSLPRCVTGTSLEARL